jgi:tRNA dimethylallyltransferase
MPLFHPDPSRNVTRTAASLPLAIALMGPTASGKTRLAIQLAQALNGEVISVDSALVFRGMDIGTAKPTPAEREGVPHHLIDLLDPAETYSTGQFRRDALALMQDIAARGGIPILAGGTMLYFHGLLHGLSELPAADPVLRRHIESEARQRDWPSLHEELARVDPLSARRIHPNDPQRIQRALEVFRLTGSPLSELVASTRPPPPPFRCFRMSLAPAHRDSLNHRIRLRFLDMLDQGLIEEVRVLHGRRDLRADLPSMRAVGYRQVWGYLEGEYGREDMIERAIIATRQFAKRQQTWLRKEQDAVRYESDASALLPTVVGDFMSFSRSRP